jgi:acyl carrier protein/alpha-ketoglutarate-dependent taurine dioxygenase
MIPSLFMVLPELPLTAAGKIDRRALRAAVPEPSVLEEIIAQHNPVEEIVAAIWCEVLVLERIGPQADFFALGGHSLLATQVVSRIRQAFGIDLPLRSLFERPTVGALAEAVQEAMHRGQRDQAPKLEPREQRGELPLSFAQQRLWLVGQLHPESSAYNIPIAFEIRGSLDLVVMERTLSEVLRRHEALRSTFHGIEGKPVQVVMPAHPCDLPVIDLRGLEEGLRYIVQGRLIGEDASRPFDLTRSPLLRVRLLRLEDDLHAAVFTMHHIAGDGWSMGVLVREISLLYQAFAAGEPSPLPALAVQYGDFAAWQRRWLADGEEELLDYWRRRLGGHLPEIALSMSRTAQPVASGEGRGELPVLFPRELTGSLRQLARREGITVFMALLAGLDALLHRLTGQEEILVGTEVAGRDRAEIEPLIGFFVNILLLRAQLNGRMKFGELLAQVRETTLGAYTHQGLPFDRLVEELQPDRRGGQAWLPQVMLVWQNAPTERLELPGLSFRSIPTREATAKFDLLLMLSEEPERIAGQWIYRADLFEAADVRRLANQLVALLELVAAEPALRLDQINVSRMQGANREAMETQEKTTKDARLSRLLAARPKAVSMSRQDLVTMAPWDPDRKLPLVLQPAVESLDVVTWAVENRPLLDEKLLLHGALLFRGFEIRSVQQFEKLAMVFAPELFGEYGDLPREGMGGKVYSSTPYPADLAILMHNESSQMHCWPLKQWFYCVTPADRGGETPIADSRQIYRLLRPALRERFETKGLLYVRNFTEGLDVSWQEFFHTSDRSAVEERCAQWGLEVEWTPRGLRTRKLAPAVARHPKTGEPVFFNQLQAHHISCVEPQVRQSLLALFDEEYLPRNVYYGDGSRLEDDEVAEVISVYSEARVDFPWQQGDMLMVDNMLSAHGRNPYSGARKIVVAMGDMVSSEDIDWNRPGRRL